MTDEWNPENAGLLRRQSLRDKSDDDLKLTCLLQRVIFDKKEVINNVNNN